SASFTTNRALYKGGAIATHTGGNIVVEGASFANNIAEFGGAIMTSAASTASVANCTFTSNQARSGGGAVALFSTGSIDEPGMLDDCSFIQNIAGEEGGGVLLSAGYTNVQRCTFLGNEAGENW
ncbi:unnamed protein product, partial [Choristocarpus tenellus]